MHQLFSSLLNFIFPPVCVHCGREGAWLCPAWQAEAHQVRPILGIDVTDCDRVLIRAAYDTPVYQALVQALKYRYWTGLQPAIGELLLPLREELRRLPPDTVIVPVPLHPHRLRERGFNQSLVVAAGVQCMTGWPIRHSLQRIRHTHQQAKLKAPDRQRNVQAAFRSRGSAPEHVLLVDDVITTGATMQACATELRRRGTRQVYGFAIAKG